MREMLRRLAAQGKTIFVSSHLLAEVRVLADVVGIIASGLVREGTLESCSATRAWSGCGSRGPTRPPRGPSSSGSREPTPARSRTVTRGWPSMSSRVARAGEPALAETGIFAAGLESGTDLELLFLELTGGTDASNEGTFGAAGAAPGAVRERGPDA